MIASRSSARLANKQVKKSEDEKSPKKKTSSKNVMDEDEFSNIHEASNRDDSSLNDFEDEDDEEEEEEEEEEEKMAMASSYKRKTTSRSFRSLATRHSDADDNLEELSCARIKLDDILSTIFKGEELNEDDYFDDDQNEYGSSPPMKLKRSRGLRKSRKRIRENGYSKASSFVLKLFDRSVDLAQFSSKWLNEDVPLYPVCRAWIKNQPSTKSMSFLSDGLNSNDQMETEELDTSLNDKPQGVKHLPAPEPKPKEKQGSEIDLRIPVIDKDQRKPKPDLIDSSINAEVNSNFGDLLEQNLIRWKKIRQNWKEAARNNELRYKHSFDVLRAMYDRTISAQANMEEDMA